MFDCFSTTYCSSAWNGADVVFNITAQFSVPLNLSQCICLFIASPVFLVFILSLSYNAASLISLCFNPDVDPSLRPLSSFPSIPLCFIPLFLLSLSLPFVFSPPQAFYPSISQLKSWFKDCFNHLSNSGGSGQEFTGAWRVWLLPVCDLKLCIVFKLIHPLFTALYNLQITVTVNIQLNNQLTGPSRSRFESSRQSSIIEKGFWKDCHAWLLIKSHGRHTPAVCSAVWASGLMRYRMCLSNVFTPEKFVRVHTR